VIAARCVEEITAADRDGRKCAALDLALEAIDDHATAGDFAAIDVLLGEFTARAGALSASLLVGLLSFTKCMSDRLAARAAFADAASNRVRELEPARAEHLLMRVAAEVSEMPAVKP